MLNLKLCLVVCLSMSFRPLLVDALICTRMRQGTTQLRGRVAWHDDGGPITNNIDRHYIVDA